MKQCTRILMYFIFVLLSSCTGDNADLKNYIYNIKHRPSKPIEPIPQFSPLPKFKFPESDLSQRNPFQPIEFKKVVDQFAPDQHRRKQLLESFPLDALKFVGILKQGSVVWALIKQPSGTISRVSIGNYMGLDYGRIVAIKADSIKLEETIKQSGKWAKHITTINLNSGK
ncbi:MAG: pilus assembly protein PilP [Legionella sp.]